MSDKPILITISGPTLAGKTRLATLLKPEGYMEVVSTTTRPSRTGEEHGVHYNFVDEETFKKMQKNNELVESSPVGPYWYGASKQAISDILDKGIPAVLVIEPKGALKVAQFCAENNINLHKVFVNNPIDVILDRFRERLANDAKATKENYSGRLWGLVVDEPKDWVEPAYNGQHPYDQVFDSFNADNEMEIFQNLLDTVNQRFTKKSTNKRKIS